MNSQLHLINAKRYLFIVKSIQKLEFNSYWIRPFLARFLRAIELGNLIERCVLTRDERFNFQIIKLYLLFFFFSLLCVIRNLYMCILLCHQAALLLVNLTSQSLPAGTNENDYKTWQGPVVMDTEYQVSLVGLTALLALLHHCQFYREMTVLLSSYYPQPNIQPTVTSEVYQLSASNSENTLSMLGRCSFNFVRSLVHLSHIVDTCHMTLRLRYA